MGLGEFIISQIEVTRLACHAMPIQSYPKHSLKGLKALAILASVLILWAGFISSASATVVWRATVPEVFYQGTFYPGYFTYYAYETDLEAVVDACQNWGPIADLTSVYSLPDLNDTYCKWTNGTAILHVGIGPQKTVLESLCTLPNVYNPNDGTCGPPPKKNIGDCSTGPSPLVGDRK